MGHRGPLLLLRGIGMGIGTGMGKEKMEEGSVRGDKGSRRLNMKRYREQPVGCVKTPPGCFPIC